MPLRLLSIYGLVYRVSRTEDIHIRNLELRLWESISVPAKFSYFGPSIFLAN